jgi:hypothetical protein
MTVEEALALMGPSRTPLDESMQDRGVSHVASCAM